MLLLFPPVAKPCEPPAGVAYLAAALQENGIDCHVADANIQGFHYLISRDLSATDSWSARALKTGTQSWRTCRTLSCMPMKTVIISGSMI